MIKKRLLLNSNSTQLGDLLVDQFDVILADRIRYKNKLNGLGFDAYLLADSLTDKDTFCIEKLCEIAGIKVIGCKRYAKSQQHLIMRSLDINTPETYFIADIGQDRRNRVTDFSLAELLADVPNDTQLIAKINDGARGVGQLYIKKDELLKYALNGFSFKDRKGEDEREMWKAASDYEAPVMPAGIEVNSHSYILPTLSSGNYIIQKYVDAKTEYRFLYFYGEEPIVIKRAKRECEWQANSCITGQGVHITNTNDMPNFSVINQKIGELAKYLNAPFLSADVYIDKDGNFGLFEFQMEFGIMYVPHDLMIDRINKSIHNILN